MAALVTGYADTLRIFFNGGVNNFLDRPVMPQVNDFNACVLQNPSHDVDGSIMAVKKRGSCNHSDIMFGLIGLNRDTHASSFGGMAPARASIPKINLV